MTWPVQWVLSSRMALHEPARPARRKDTAVKQPQRAHMGAYVHACARNHKQHGTRRG